MENHLLQNFIENIATNGTKVLYNGIKVNQKLSSGILYVYKTFDKTDGVKIKHINDDC